jgi:cytoskeletal protein RodZ
LPESLVWAIVAVSVGGLALLIGLMAVMKNELHFANGLILLFSLLTFVLLLGAESVFIWLLLSTHRRAQGRENDAADSTQLKGTATRELSELQERLLAEPGVSVTEHTTRTLEPVYRERKNS